jgi:hypothetical protein
MLYAESAAEGQTHSELCCIALTSSNQHLAAFLLLLLLQA